jgi:hypothetical protein
MIYIEKTANKSYYKFSHSFNLTIRVPLIANSSVKAQNKLNNKIIVYCIRRLLVI